MNSRDADLQADPLARLLDFGLAALVIAAPLPLASVTPQGRLVMEVATAALFLLWWLRSLRRPTALPPRLAQVGLVGLLALAALQLVPLGSVVVGTISPRAESLRSATVPPASARAAEAELLGVPPKSLDARSTLSLDRGATASALRAGTAMAALLWVGATVGAARGARVLCTALLISAAFQGSYGLLVLASGSNRIWHLPKEYYLDCATGTFINRSHFACYLAMALACGTALILGRARASLGVGGRIGLARELSGDGSRTLLWSVLLLLGTAGLLASFSRAGIALGILAISYTILALNRGIRLRTRLVVACLLFTAAAVPLVQLGADRLVQRYAESAENLTSPGGRARVWGDTLRMAADFPLGGTGFGTFSLIYPTYRSPQVRLFYRHAHNDLIQALAEGGLLGALFLALLLGSLLQAVAGGLSGAKGALGVGLAAALAAVLLHGLIDFNFHITANAMTASIIAGMLLGVPWTKTD